MKTIKLLAFLFAAQSLSMNAQCPLPTGESFENFTTASSFTANAMYPGSWTSNISGTFTYGSGQAGLSAKLDIVNEYVQVNTNDAMGVVSYYLKGFNTGAAWQGTFKLQESVNGSVWTDLTVFTNNLNQNSFVNYTVTPNTNSRYLRWNFTTKVSGHNVALDEINIAPAPITAQEINVKQGANTILSGGNTALFNSAVGTPTTINFSVENLGSATALNITSYNITGPAAADFSVTAPAAPAVVNASSSVPLTLSFNPSAAGTRSAVLTINNDDANESAYVINLNGIGGNLATQPASQATALNFSNIKSYRAKADFTAASGSPDGYLILKKQGTSAITDVPVDGVMYKVGDAIGSSKVMYAGNGTTNLGINNVYAGLTYQIAIYTYNGSGTYVNYNDVAPLTGNFTTLATMQPVNEYASINTNSASFLTSLSAQIYPHQSIFYGNYDETMIKLFTARDTTNGQKVVTCVYSNQQYVYTEPFIWGYMSREHSYCHQWMPTNPADGSAAAPNNVERPEYNDQHHLFPTNQDDVNAVRSNRPMGEVVTQSGSYLSAKWGKDKDSNFVFEPRAQHKGDFARAIMYMATAYNGQNNPQGVAQNWKLKNPISGTILYGQDQNILKKWHFQDLPDAYEMSRNDFLDSLQGNRNPFVDSVRYACYIDFSNMTYISNPSFPCFTAVGIKENVPTHFEYVLAPNPTSGEFSLLIDAKVAEKFNMDVTDVAGRNVYRNEFDVDNGFNNITIQDLKLQAGVYFVNLNYKNEKITRKLIIQ